MKTYNGNKVLFHGELLEVGLKDPESFSTRVKAEGLDGPALIPNEVMDLINFTVPCDLIVVNYEFYGTSFWTICPSSGLETSDQTVEELIRLLDLTAPSITPEHIDSMVKKAIYHVFPGTNTTVCCIVLPNGFTVIGDSACVSDENFNEEVGRKVAFAKAKGLIGQFEGYLLCQAINKSD